MAIDRFGTQMKSQMQALADSQKRASNRRSISTAFNPTSGSNSGFNSAFNKAYGASAATSAKKNLRNGVFGQASKSALSSATGGLSAGLSSGIQKQRMSSISQKLGSAISRTGSAGGIGSMMPGKNGGYNATNLIGDLMAAQQTPSNGVPGGSYGGTGATGQKVGSIANYSGGNFDPTSDALIQQTSDKYGIPPNFLKAIITNESSGDWRGNANSVSSVRGGKRIFGYIGAFDDALRYWGITDLDALEGNQAAQIDALGIGLKKFYDMAKQENQSYDWRNVAVHHFSGNWVDQGYGDELGNTTSGYLAKIEKYWQMLDQAAGNSFNPDATGSGGSSYTGGATGSAATIFGGTVPGRSQGLESNDWTASHPSMYAYGREYGLTGGEHTGIDYVVPYGSTIKSGTSGSVVWVGPGAGFESDGGGAGRIEVRLDNGHTIIYGHMSGSSVAVGQRVNPGDLIGQSGTAGSGAHMHLEYRIPDSSQGSGWRIVDPDQYLNGPGGPATPAQGAAPQQQSTTMQPYARQGSVFSNQQQQSGYSGGSLFGRW